MSILKILNHLQGFLSSLSSSSSGQDEQILKAEIITDENTDCDIPGIPGLKRCLESNTRIIAGLTDSKMWIAADSGDFAFLKKLDADGYDITASDGMGNTPLHYSSEQGYTDIVRYLTEIQPDINVRNHEGKTPMILAAEKNRISTVRILIMKGANPCIRSSPDLYIGNMHARVAAKTALDYARDHANDELIRLIESAVERYNK